MLAVLIVDDDHAFRTVLRTLFEECSGFDNCVEAANASEALDKSKRLTPNLAVVDFSMPEMNGLQLARQLKAREPALPIFMLTRLRCEHREGSPGLWNNCRLFQT